MRERTGFADRTVVVLVAVVVVANLASGSIASGIVVALAATPFAGRGSSERRGFAVVALTLVTLGASGPNTPGARLAPATWDPSAGWVRLVDDPQPTGRGTRVIFEIDGERFETVVARACPEQRIGNWNGGDWVLIAGDRGVLEPDRARRVAWQHVVGEFEVDWASDVEPAAPSRRASNRVRATIERGASAIPDDDGALFRGLVVGDDRDQPRR